LVACPAWVACLAWVACPVWLPVLARLRLLLPALPGAGVGEQQVAGTASAHQR
jgi:hypothetical protein